MRRYRPSAPPPPPPESLFLSGPVRALKDHKRRQIVIETAKEHPEGFGIEICRLPMHRVEEARSIVGLHELLRSQRPFAAFSAEIEGPADAPLFGAVTLGDVRAAADAYRKATGKDAAPAHAAALPGAGIVREPKPANKP